MTRQGSFALSNHSPGPIDVTVGQVSTRYQRRAGRKIQHVDLVRRGDEESLAIGIGNRFRIGQGHSLRVLVDATNPIFVVKMRTRRETCLTDIADDLRELDLLAATQLCREARQVAINRDDAGAMFELDDVAVSALISNETHPTIARGPNWSAHRCCVIDAAVCTNAI